jgi:hypothetical protein
MPATVPNGGTYTLEIDTGFDVGSFRLDDPAKGVLDNTDYLLGPTTTFADVTEYVKRIDYRRGRHRPTDQFGAGTMTVVIDDELAGGALSPYDIGSPYYDPNNNQPGIAPMRAIRLLRGTEYLFTGIINTFDYQFEMSGDNTVILQCVDGFYQLSQAVLDEWNVTSETSGQRIDSMLDLPEIDLFPGALRDIDPGTVNLGHDAAYTVPAGTNALVYAQQINQTSEFGRLFMAANGVLTFQPRIGTTLSGPVINFSDTNPLQAKYNDIQIEFDASNVVNRAVVTGLDGDTGIADDLPSQAQYFIQTNSITNSLLHEQTELDDAALYLIKGQPEPRFTSVQTAFLMLTNTQRDQAAAIDIGDTISVAKTVTGVGTIAEELSVEGIDGTITFDTGHTVRFWTAPTTVVYELILDDPVYGVLDAGNVLG